MQMMVRVAPRAPQMPSGLVTAQPVLNRQDQGITTAAASDPGAWHADSNPCLLAGAEVQAYSAGYQAWGTPAH
jgi:hypothetical protein